MDIGFYLLDIQADNDKQTKIIDSINDLCKYFPYANIVLFNNQYNNIYKDNKFYTLHIQQAKYFDGILFVFDTRSAMLTQTFPAPKKQILYIAEPEWCKDTSIPHSFWYDIYMKENIELIVANNEMYDLCEICWKKPISIVSDINGTEFKNVISQL